MDWAVLLPYLPQLGAGLLASIGLTFAAAATSLLGALGLIALSRSRWSVLGRCIRIYTEIIMGMPVLVLLYLVYFVLPAFNVRLEEVPAGLLALTLYYSPYMAEAMRGGLAAIPAGQLDAARQIGMSERQVFARILFPQAIGLMLPPLTGLVIGLAKDTAILSVISVREFAFETKQVVSRTYAPFEVWTAVAGVYWLLLTSFEMAMRRVERRAIAFRTKD
jgi:His/Glu/Gln/Arg/opine family amino acid ABC transporter permease subunit